MRSLFHRGVVILAIVALLFVTVAAFGDDGQLQPPTGSQGHLQPPIGAPSHSAGFLDLLLVWFEALI